MSNGLVTRLAIFSSSQLISNRDQLKRMLYYLRSLRNMNTRRRFFYDMNYYPSKLFGNEKFSI